MITEDINAMKYDPLYGYFAHIEYNKNEKAY